MTKEKFNIEKCDLSAYDDSELRRIRLFAHQFAEATATDCWTDLDCIEDLENAIWKEVWAIGAVLTRIGKMVAMELKSRGEGTAEAPDKECA